MLKKTLISLFVILSVIIIEFYDFSSLLHKKEYCNSPSVIDGDTIRCSNYSSSIRIIPSADNPSIWFDAPETSIRHAECPSELILGDKSSYALEILLLEHGPTQLISPIPPSPDRDHYNRLLRELRVEITPTRFINPTHILSKVKHGAIYHKSRHPFSWCPPSFTKNLLNKE